MGRQESDMYKLSAVEEHGRRSRCRTKSNPTPSQEKKIDIQVDIDSFEKSGT